MTTGLYKKIKWLMVIRLIIITIILVAGSFMLLIEKLPFYCLIALVYLASIGYSFFLRKKKWLNQLAYVQIIGDVLVETAVIHYSGGIESVFAILYVLSIISASIVISARSSIIIASAAGILYTALVGLEYIEIIPQVSANLGLYEEGFVVIYLIYVRVTIFGLVGFLSGYLAQRINQVEKRMMQREKLLAMGQFAASIAHQIRNPLASLSGSVELLKERLNLDKSNQQLMEVVVRESNRLGGIIDQFLEYTRGESLKLELNDLNEILSEVLAMVKENKDFNPDIKVVRENEDIKIIANIDHHQIKQALFNIVTNAYEAMPEGGTLTLFIKNEVDYADINISDTGIGMPADHLKQVFEPFKTTTKETGTGMGLVIANCIIENHGGRIIVKSAEGKGSTFIVRLPKQNEDTGK